MTDTTGTEAQHLMLASKVAPKDPDRQRTRPAKHALGFAQSVLAPASRLGSYDCTLWPRR